MNVGRIAGVQLVLNRYFLALLCLYFLAGVLVKALVVFGLVFYHELFHVVTAGWMGIKVREIELLPFGGVAKMEDLLELRPSVEMKVALAGPFSNALLLALLWSLRIYGIGSEEFWLSADMKFLQRANILMLAFNLLPALPLDGGRIYRAFLAPRVGFKEATELAAGMGRGIAVLLGVLGLGGLYFELTGLDFFIIVLFLFVAASKERSQAHFVFLHALTRKQDELADKGVLMAQVLVGQEDAPVKDIIQRFVPRKYHLVIVMDKNWRFLGLLNENELVTGLLEKGYLVPLAGLLNRDRN